MAKQLDYHTLREIFSRFQAAEAEPKGELDHVNVYTLVVAVALSAQATDAGVNKATKELFKVALGNTLGAIASEKAGIMKDGVPVIIGEKHAETQEVFKRHARAKNAPLFWSAPLDIATDLTGNYQVFNSNTAATALSLLFPEERALWELGFSRVIQNTGLQGRWQQIGDNPIIICDTGHNEHALKQIVKQAHEAANHVHWVLGMAADKEHAKALNVFPKTDSFYWTSSSSLRTIDSVALAEIALTSGYHGAAYSNVQEALNTAIKHAKADDLIFVGGSTFVVADLKI